MIRKTIYFSEVRLNCTTEGSSLQDSLLKLWGAKCFELGLVLLVSVIIPQHLIKSRPEYPKNPFQPLIFFFEKEIHFKPVRYKSGILFPFILPLRIRFDTFINSLQISSNGFWWVNPTLWHSAQILVESLTAVKIAIEMFWYTICSCYPSRRNFTNRKLPLKILNGEITFLISWGISWSQLSRTFLIYPYRYS